MSLAERLRQRRGRDFPTDDGYAPAPTRSSIAVEPFEGEQPGPLADMRREQLEEAPLVGLPELRAAALMVAEGLARRVILSGFETWPGLLTEMERLSERFDLSILPVIGHASGRIDLVVSREDGHRQDGHAD